MTSSCGCGFLDRACRSAGIILGLLVTMLAAPAAWGQQAGETSAAEEPARASEQRLALVIGNSSYKDAPLANPVNDARDMAVALAGLGFRVIIRKNADRRTLIAYWQSVQAGNNPADLDAYLKRYPQGQFTDLARSRIAALGSKTQPATAAGSTAAASAQGVARVHFFRERAFVGSLINYRIEHNGKPVGSLGNGSYFSYDAPPGQHEFAPVGNFGRGGTFTLEAGKTYHIELRVVPFSASFELVGSERGEEAVRSLR